MLRSGRVRRSRCLAALASKPTLPVKLVGIYPSVCGAVLSDCGAARSGGGGHSSVEHSEDESTDLSDFIVADDEPLERCRSSSATSSSEDSHGGGKRRGPHSSPGGGNRRQRKRPCLSVSSLDEDGLAAPAAVSSFLGTPPLQCSSAEGEVVALLGATLASLENIQQQLTVVRASVASLCALYNSART